MNNLDFWDSVEETPPQHTKKVSYGTRKFTTISAQYQIKQATDKFGMYGDKWGIDKLDVTFKDLAKDQILAVGNCLFFYTVGDKRIEFIISSSIFVQQWSNQYKVLVQDDEFAKKLETDITTKALSKLGFSADVFLGKYDDNKYVNALKDKYNPADGKEQSQKTTQTTKPIQKPIPKKIGLEMASNRDVAIIINLVKKGMIRKAENGLAYWQNKGRGMFDKDLKKVNDLISALTT